jgi:hypothetical protein
VAYFDSPCEVRRAGINSAGQAQLDMRAVNGTFGWTWLLSADNLGREMLAVALAAMASNRQLNVGMTLPDPPGADPSWTKIQSLILM